MRVLVEGSGGEFAVDDEGRVWSCVPPYCRDHTPTPEWRHLPVTLNKDGYEYVHLRRRRTVVHQLVFAAFHGALPNGHEINHIDGVKRNNRPSNLESCTHADNMKHAWANGLVPRIRNNAESRKTHCPFGHPYDEHNTYIQVHANGKRSRSCRECKRERNRQRRRAA